MRIHRKKTAVGLGAVAAIVAVLAYGGTAIAQGDEPPYTEVPNSDCAFDETARVIVPGPNDVPQVDPNPDPCEVPTPGQGAKR